MGYHYPRSISTARKSAGYFERFYNDYGFCINKEFEQIYATSSSLSWTNGNDFKTFCENASIPCFRTDSDRYFKSGMCDDAFITKEYSYDAKMLKNWLLKEIADMPNVRVEYNSAPRRIERTGNVWKIDAERGYLNLLRLSNGCSITSF